MKLSEIIYAIVLIGYILLVLGGIYILAHFIIKYWQKFAEYETI